MSAPRIDQINLVLADVAAAAAFLARLGLDVDTTPPPWDSHHRSVPASASGFDIDLDSSAFARHWGGVPDDFVGVVVIIRVDDRAEVDRLYALALASGRTTGASPTTRSGEPDSPSWARPAPWCSG